MDIERRSAIAELLARPDPPELRRGHRLKLQGKSDRYNQLPMLAAAYVQAKLLELDRADAGPEVQPAAASHSPLRALRAVRVAA